MYANSLCYVCNVSKRPSSLHTDRPNPLRWQCATSLSSGFLNFEIVLKTISRFATSFICNRNLKWRVPFVWGCATIKTLLKRYLDDTFLQCRFEAVRSSGSSRTKNSKTYSCDFWGSKHEQDQKTLSHKQNFSVYRTVLLGRAHESQMPFTTVCPVREMN